MGMGMAQNQNQVYFDPATGQYYTGYGYNNGFFSGRNYINDEMTRNQNKPSQTVTDAIARANAAAQNVNTPTLQSLFPGMAMPSQFTSPMANLTGQFGAGRFLGQNASQFSNPSMMGFAPNTTNTTT